MVQRNCRLGKIDLEPLVILNARLGLNELSGLTDFGFAGFRPAPRSFLKRLTTRVVPSLDNAAAREEKYSIVKMPRGDYKRHFKRDVYGNYAGSEDERKW